MNTVEIETVLDQIEGRPKIVIIKKQEGSTGPLQGNIASGAWTGVSRANESQIQGTPEGCDRRLDRDRRTVIYHDNLERIFRDGLPREPIQAQLQFVGPIKRWDHNRDRRRRGEPWKAE